MECSICEKKMEGVFGWNFDQFVLMHPSCASEAQIVPEIEDGMPATTFRFEQTRDTVCDVCIVECEHAVDSTYLIGGRICSLVTCKEHTSKLVWERPGVHSAFEVELVMLDREETPFRQFCAGCGESGDLVQGVPGPPVSGFVAHVETWHDVCLAEASRNMVR